ncbi:hypothetical protein ACQ4PT_001871 [Festuca glaucescens]
MEPEPRRWAATYTTQLKKKRKAYHDGGLLLHPDTRRLVLLDDAKFLRASDSISVGASIEFPCHLVDVGEAQRGHSGRSSEPAASRTAYRGGARPRQSAPNTSAEARVLAVRSPRIPRARLRTTVLRMGP